MRIGHLNLLETYLGNTGGAGHTETEVINTVLIPLNTITSLTRVNPGVNVRNQVDLQQSN